MSDLILPPKILDQHLVVLGKTGAGKSSALRHIVEHLLTQKKRVCIVDPKGDWWGLKRSADGKSAGFPAIAFGDFKEARATDIPLNAQAGKHVAELIAAGNRPAIIGLRGWMTSHLVEFWIDFASTLFNTNAGELYLVGDEFHNFAPKGRIMDPEAGKCLHWSNRLINEGRGLGLVCLIASQRPQKVHNDTLTACETLVAMRVIHKSDRGAVKDWIEGCGDIDKGKEVLDGLAGLARGSGWVWSPENDFGPEVVKFPMFKTFDSFAPPQLQKKVSGSDWSNVDLEAVKSKLATVIEEHKQNDPAELKRTIAQLKRELASKPAAAAPKIEQKEVPVFSKDEMKLMQSLSGAISELMTDQNVLWTKVLDLNQLLSNLPKRFGSAPVVRPSAPIRQPAAAVTHRAPAAPASSPATNGSEAWLASGEKKILSAAAQYPQGITREQASILTGFKRSTRDAYILRLLQKGYVSLTGDGILASDAGIEALGADFEPLPTGEALIQYWHKKLPPGERAIWEQAISRYPESLSRESLEESTGFKRSTRDAYISRLAARKVIEIVGRGEIRANKEFFV